VIVLGIDLGERRVGFAVSDERERLAVPSGFARINAPAEALAAVAAKAKAEGAGLLVVGHPLNLDGRAGPKAREAAQFRDRLAEAGWNAVLWDERLTTREAARLLKEAGLNRRRRQGRLDSEAARLLLESFLAGSRKRPP
jgi:putative Holliday junction resolvase